MAQHTWYKVHGTANSLLKRPVHTKSKVVGKEVLSLTLTLDPPYFSVQCIEARMQGSKSLGSQRVKVEKKGEVHLPQKERKKIHQLVVGFSMRSSQHLHEHCSLSRCANRSSTVRRCKSRCIQGCFAASSSSWESWVGMKVHPYNWLSPWLHPACILLTLCLHSASTLQAGPACTY